MEHDLDRLSVSEVDRSVVKGDLAAAPLPRHPNGSVRRASVIFSVARNGKHHSLWGWGKPVGASAASGFELVRVVCKHPVNENDEQYILGKCIGLLSNRGGWTHLVTYAPLGGLVPAGWSAGKPFQATDRKYIKYTLDIAGEISPKLHIKNRRPRSRS